MSRNFGIEGSFKAGVRQFWFIHFMPLISDVYDGLRGKNAPRRFGAGLWCLSGYELLCNRWQLLAQLYIMDLLQAT
jgi:hypothetical protein